MKAFTFILILGWSLTAMAQARPGTNGATHHDDARPDPGAQGARSASGQGVFANHQPSDRRLPPISNEAMRHFLKGRAWFKVQAYDKAIAEWTRAHLLHSETFPHPLFNIALARLQAASLVWDRKQRFVEEQRAYFAYQTFLEATKDPIYLQDPELMKFRPVAEKTLALLENELDKLEAALRAEDKKDHDQGVRICQVAFSTSSDRPACICPASAGPLPTR